MKEIEDQQAECKQIQQQINEQQQVLENIRKESEAKADEHETELKTIQDEWNKAASIIPNELLKIFKRVAETYDGEALAGVEQHEGKKGAFTCGGCFMEVPAEMVNLLITKDDVIRCPNCTRILVLSKESLGLGSSEEN
jgi:predicted  nucleic acid-binding Zn-ribbon protein